MNKANKTQQQQTRKSIGKTIAETMQIEPNPVQKRALPSPQQQPKNKISKKDSLNLSISSVHNSTQCQGNLNFSIFSSDSEAPNNTNKLPALKFKLKESFFINFKSSLKIYKEIIRCKPNIDKSKIKLVKIID